MGPGTDDGFGPGGVKPAVEPGAGAGIPAMAECRPVPAGAFRDAPISDAVSGLGPSDAVGRTAVRFMPAAAPGERMPEAATAGATIAECGPGAARAIVLGGRRHGGGGDESLVPGVMMCAGDARGPR